MPTPEAVANGEQIEYWNGAAGERWVAAQDAMDIMLEPFSAAVMEATGIGKGEEIIDLGCGCGATTLELARRVGLMGRVLAVDVSTPMLRRAQERATKAGHSHVVFVNADASTYRFESHAFDLAFSRFGVMFFRNPREAFVNIRAALQPGGRLAFVCWRAITKNEWVTVPRAAALRHVPPMAPPAPGEPGPFAFADPAHVAAILGGAGFRGITFRELDVSMRHTGSLEEVADGMARIGPAARLIMDAGEDVRARIIADLAREIAPRHDGKGVDLNSAAWIVTATA